MAEEAAHQVEEVKEAGEEEQAKEVGEEEDVKEDEPSEIEANPLSFASIEREMGEAPEVVKEPDKRRPILRASSYKPPSKTSWTLAFIFFGVSGVVLWVSVPDLRGIMWPWGDTGPEFSRNMDVQIKDVNTLRDTSNISQITLFVQVPLFLVTWGMVLAYLFGVVTIVFPTLRIVIPKARERWQNRKERRG